MLPQVGVPDDNWKGLTEYLAELRQRRSGSSKYLKALPASTEKPRMLQSRKLQPRTSRHPKSSKPTIYEAAHGLSIRIFDLATDENAEEAFARYRERNKNSYFTTQRNTWRCHRLHCSSLAFNGDQKLTMRPKVCADRVDELERWANKLGVDLAVCRRCPKPV